MDELFDFEMLIQEQSDPFQTLNLSYFNDFHNESIRTFDSENHGLYRLYCKVEEAFSNRGVLT